ncbi:phosphatidylglycerophosphatase A family protein [Sulfurospirillum barnesii]|uniref:Phosphatidylglycerophosphatase A-like protein n=1 Tax=Sulfurospirillum barnesii (strain ATCC 700032 / DSM 10660 / SES-3) TaxID=760154 RepID=I3XYP6_SULBS|nr:phosphatidylglycerophosphatase A [Sulfurospirillum barnesii]AFL69070.1 phosphatidylglycerophosphatase A-like protein [Sulfurospirillum barnesii SES-3]
MRPNIFLTFFYSGLSPKASGTAGSLLALGMGVGIINYISMETLVLLTILFSLVGIKEINTYEAKSGNHDDKRIVIDEVVGMWIALILSSSTPIQIALSFIFFRLFDIWKPSVIGRIDRNIQGGLGVMGDDMVAGVLAGICSAGVFQLMGIAQNALLN